MVVWDLPLRIFHWSLMICVIGAVASGKMENMDLHERFGLAIMGLIVFRIIWGFIGSQTARFSHFVKGPKAFLTGLKALWNKQSDSKAGHSAVGGYATLALLAIPLMMAITGSFSTDDILYDGPFYHLMPQWAKQAGTVHHFGEKLIFLIVILHLSALAYYFFRVKKNLIPAMVTGKSGKSGKSDKSDKSDKATGTGGALSRGKTIFGLVLMAAIVIIAQLATQLRPDYF